MQCQQWSIRLFFETWLSTREKNAINEHSHVNVTHIDFLDIFKIFNFTKHGHVINYKHKTSKKIGY